MDRDAPTPLEQPLPVPRAKPRSAASLWALWGVIATTTLIVGAGAGALWPAGSGDRVPADVDAKRQALFSTLEPIPIIPAAEDEEERLAESMRLSPAEKQLLLKTVREEKATLATAAANLPEAAAPQPAAAQKGAAAALPKPLQKAARPITFAQITLWDTDAEDGDVVRIVSAGYETVVVLGKVPVTLAVPVPPRGVINIIGERDGGGGITAGIAVGGRIVELPVMSAGQTLGIPVMARP